MSKKKISDDCLKAFLDEEFTQVETAKACGCSKQAIHIRIHRKKMPVSKSALCLNYKDILNKLNNGQNQKSIMKEYNFTSLSHLMQKYIDKKTVYKLKPGVQELFDQRIKLKKGE